MLLILGGFLGCGRRVVAQRIGKKAGYYFYNIDERTPLLFSFDKTGRLNRRMKWNMTDDERIEFYDKVVLPDLALLYKQRGNVVMDDTFHRIRVRGHVLAHAVRIFDDVRFVWIEASDETVRETLEAMVAAGTLKSVPLALKRRAVAVRNYEPIGPDTPQYVNTRDYDQLAESLL